MFPVFIYIIYIFCYIYNGLHFGELIPILFQYLSGALSPRLVRLASSVQLITPGLLYSLKRARLHPLKVRKTDCSLVPCFYSSGYRISFAFDRALYSSCSITFCLDHGSHFSLRVFLVVKRKPVSVVRHVDSPALEYLIPSSLNAKSI